MEFLANEKVLVAIIAAVSAIIGGVISSIVSPWIKVRLEEKSKETERKRALIKEWRDMLLEVQSKVKFENDVGRLVQLHPAFMSLEPLLNKKVSTSVYAENRTIVVGSSLSAPLRGLKDEISRIESEWRLR